MRRAALQGRARRWRQASGALVLLTVFGSLRWGELAALRRSDIDVQARTVRISRQLSEQRGGGFTFGPPKSDAGYRTVAIPAVITPDLASHIVTFAAPGDDGLVFTNSEGKPLRRSNFCRRVWHPALRAAGLPAIHFHDLRHTGNQFAETGRVASDASWQRIGQIA